MHYSSLDKPENIAHVFAEAWAHRDAEKLASLFDVDAEFVNVTGLWWHDRTAIRKAHAYGFAHIFNASTLRLMKVKVKMLADNIAVLHARIRIEGQSRAAEGDRPAIRNTIFSFVVHCQNGTWSCASAHNTDVVPQMETNIVDPNGTFRSVSYRR